MDRYLSDATMITPGNDASVAYENPLARSIFDEAGMFVGASFIVLGTAVRDARTELNDEATSSTACFGQPVPEPSTILLSLLGVGTVAWRMRKRVSARD